MPVKPMAVASVAAVPDEPAPIPIPIPAPIPEPIPEPIRMPTNDTVPIAPPPPPPPRLETVPFPAEAQSVTKARPVVNLEPSIAPVTNQSVDAVSPKPVEPPLVVAAPIAVPVPAPDPVSAPPAAASETSNFLRRIVTRVTRFFRSLFG